MKSKTIASILLLAFLHSSTFAAESAPKPIKEAEPWQNNRLTSEQPFPARVVGVAQSWVGYQLLLEEVDKDPPRYCYVFVSQTRPLQYIETTKEDSAKIAQWRMEVPGVLVSDFNIDGKMFKLGSKFGREDLLRSAIEQTKREAEQAAPSNGDKHPK